MKRSPLKEDARQTRSELPRTVGIVHLLAICVFGGTAVVTACGPAAAQSADVRPAYGGATKLSATNDDDGDRVVDSRDMCPGTPEGWSVKHNGCPVYQKSRSTITDAGGAQSGVTKIALNSDILFATASARITSQGASILTRFAAELNAMPHIPVSKREIRLSGHADFTGQWASNLVLSQRRADAVRSHLIGLGVPSVNMKAVGYGSAAPLVLCPETGTRAELAMCLAPNRRVEIEVRPLPDGA